jgi:hypothetical protein
MQFTFETMLPARNVMIFFEGLKGLSPREGDTAELDSITEE